MASTAAGGAESRCPVNFHPLRWEDVADPYPALKALRDQCPVSTVTDAKLPAMKLITRFELASQIYRDPETFANMGIVINKDEVDVVPPGSRQIIASNGEHHAAKRRFALLALSPENVDQHMAAITDYARELTAKLPRGQEFDLMAEWAANIPSVATARILGLPDEEALEFRKWIRAGVEHQAKKMSPSSPDFEWFTPASRNVAGDGYAGGAMFPESVDAVGRLLRNRRADPNPPKGDLLDKMLNFRDDETGTTYTDAEIVAQMVTLIAAGNDTTGGHIGNLVYRMLTVPGLWDRLKSDRNLINLAIEESLRLDPVQAMFPKRVTRDTEMGGVEFKKDEVIIISMASGNRDESVYGDDVDQFNLDRKFPNPRHLSMGRGVHTCIGAYQARKITRVAINALLDAVEEMEVAPGYTYEKVLFHHFRAPQRLPVTITR